MIFVGIDNGVTGTVGVLGLSDPVFIETPTVQQRNYTQSKQVIRRLDHLKFAGFFNTRILPYCANTAEIIVLVESPMVNRYKFRSTASALRSFEATCIILEQLGIGYDVRTSHQWQKALLPNYKGRDLKKASVDLCVTLFPDAPFLDMLRKHGDGDGLLIAYYQQQLYSKNK